MKSPVELCTVVAALLLYSSPASGAKIEKYESSKVLRGFHHLAERDVDIAHVKGEFLDATTSTEIRFVDKLQSDADVFISDVKSWITGVVGDTPQSEVIVTSEFSLETKGDFDVDSPCGDLTAYKTFPVIKKFLDDPQYATLDDAAANSIMWHPSKAYVGRGNSVEVDGGSHVEFVATCGDKLLLNVSSANGGVTKTVFFKKVETTGAFVGVDFSDGDIRAAGATGRLISKLKLRQIPDKVDQVLKTWTEKLRGCAAQNKLEITGVVGGGWTQKYSKYGGLVGTFDTYVLAYAESFKITYQSRPTEAPVTEAPTMQPPATEASTTEPPVTAAPVIEPPATEAPATEVPVTTEPPTEAPKTKEPETDAPDAEPGTTEPETDAPDTNEPGSEEPTDAPETTEPVSEIDAPTETETPADAPETMQPETTEPETDAPTGEPETTKPKTDAPTDVPATTTEPGSESPSSFEPAAVEPITTTDPTTSTAADEPGNKFEEPALFDPSTTISPTPTITDTDPNTPFAFSRVVDLDLTRSSLKELSDSTASMYMKAGEKCAGAWYEGGCFMNTAMTKTMHGRFGSVTLDMSVTNESSALPTTHSLASFAGLGFLAAVLIAFVVKRTKTRRHGYAAIPSETEPINSGSI